LSLLDHNRYARIPLSYAASFVVHGKRLVEGLTRIKSASRKVEAQVLKSFAGIVIGTFLGAYIATASPHVFNTWVGGIAWADWR
jgi:hypothetical protein